MSKENTPLLEQVTDLTEKDMLKVEQFIEAGKPGLATLDQVKLTKIMDLYLSGKTYHQISQITETKLPVVLYLSHKFKWFQTRQEYFIDLESTIKSRLLEAKVINQDFLLQLIQFWQKRIGNNINKYLSTGDEEFAQRINPKDIDKYLKTLGILHQISSDPKHPMSASPIGLNLGEGVTITRKNNNEVEITPKQNTIKEMLKQLSDLKRSQDESPDSEHDISNSEDSQND
jgi:hypothetical protein